MGLMFTRDKEFDSLFLFMGKKHAIDPALLKGITAAESAFDPTSILVEGDKTPVRGEQDASMGLMQVLKSAAVYGGFDRNRPFTDLFQPEIGIDFGARELKKYLDDPLTNSKDDPELRKQRIQQSATGMPRVADAVASYNMGFPRSIKATTQKIATIYDSVAAATGYPGYAKNWQAWKISPPPNWVYANQPYVDKVLSYAALYRADFNGDTAQVQSIMAEIKKKDCRRLHVSMRVLQYPWAACLPLELSATLSGKNS